MSARKQSFQLVLEVDGQLKETLPVPASPLAARTRQANASNKLENKNKFEVSAVGWLQDLLTPLVQEPFVYCDG